MGRVANRTQTQVIAKAIGVCSVACIIAMCTAMSLSVAINAQPATPSLDDALKVRISLLGRGSADSIVLRWAPSKPAVWLIGSRIGYRIDRANVQRDGKHDAFRPLVDTAIVPWDGERWIAYKDAHPESDVADSANYVAIAYLMLSRFDGAEKPARDEYSSDELKSVAERKQELDMRFTYAMYAVDRSVSAAAGLGLRFVDRSVTSGATYIYRVYLAGSAGDHRPDTGFATVTAAAPPLVATTPAEADGGEKEVVLRWQANGWYGSYFVERSDDGGRSYRRLTVVPHVTLRGGPVTEADEEVWRDSTAINYRPYIYRVFGTTPFAELDMLAEVRGMARDATPPARPFLPNPEHISAREVRVKWIPGIPAAPDLAGYSLARAATDSGAWTTITPTLLSPSTTEFVDTRFNADTSNFYYVEAVDTAGNVVRSNAGYVALIDSTPPAAPTWVSGTIDTNGLITLRLRSNRERDLMGYRLLRSNAPDHEFTVVIESFGDSTIVNPRDTIYYDSVTIKTLTRRVYYRAIALDANHNESAFSEILSITRPDVIPPITPVVTDVFVTDKTVMLTYAASTSEDLAYHVVYRTIGAGEKWDSVARTHPLDSVFTDRDVKSTVVYQYALLAVDSSALRSELSTSVSARPYNSGLIPPVTNMRARYDAASSKVEVRWDYTELLEDHWFIVYREDGDGNLSQYARVSSTQRSMDDVSAPRGTVTYAVRAVAASGAESKVAERADVVVGE